MELMTLSKKLIIAGTVLCLLCVGQYLTVRNADATTCLYPGNGGTGLCSATSTNIGQIIGVTNVTSTGGVTVPIYGFVNASSTTGGSGSTTVINGVQGPNFTITIIGTSSPSNITTSSANLFLNLLLYASSSQITISTTGTIMFATTSISQFANDAGYIKSSPATSTINGFTGTVFNIIGDGITVTSTVLNGSTTFSNISGTGVGDYFFTSTSSDLSSNKIASDTPQSSLASTTVAALSNGTTSIQMWSTNANIPGVSFIPPGLIDVHIDSAQTAGTKPTFLFATVTEVSATGSVLGTIATTGNGAVLTATLTSYDLDTALATPYTMVSTASRIQVNVIASVSGALLAPTVQVYYGGTSGASRLELPGQTADITNFVPYVGAIRSINLGSNSLSTTGNVTTTNLTVGSLAGVLFGTNGVVSAIATSSLGLPTSIVATGTLISGSTATGPNITIATSGPLTTWNCTASTCTETSIPTSTILAGYSTSTPVSLAGAYLAASGSQLTVSSTLATSSWKFVINSATSTNNTSTYAFWQTDQKVLLNKFECFDTIATTSLIFLQSTAYATSTVSSTIISNIPCGTSGSSTALSNVFATGSNLLVEVSSTAGTPRTTPVQIIYTKQ